MENFTENLYRAANALCFTFKDDLYTFPFPLLHKSGNQQGHRKRCDFLSRYIYVCNTEEDVKNRVIRTQNVQRYLDRLLQNKHYLSCEMELMYASNII